MYQVCLFLVLTLQPAACCIYLQNGQGLLAAAVGLYRQMSQRISGGADCFVSTNEQCMGWSLVLQQVVSVWAPTHNIIL